MMGMGVLGLVALQLLKAAGAAPIIAVDPMAEKREKALQCGADYALDPFEEGFSGGAAAVKYGAVQQRVKDFRKLCQVRLNPCALHGITPLILAIIP